MMVCAAVRFKLAVHVKLEHTHTHRILPVVAFSDVVENFFIVQRIIPHVDVCQLTIKTREVNDRLTCPHILNTHTQTHTQ